MLINDLLRFRIGHRTIQPSYLTRKSAPYYLGISGELLDIYDSHIGRTRGELESSLELFEADRVNYRILRGLAKIIDGFAIFEPDNSIDYPNARLSLFKFAETYRPIVKHPDLVHTATREEVVNLYHRKHEALPKDLYGDLPDAFVLRQMTRRLRPDEVIRRYNLALAQGILYRSYRMHFHIADGYKEVFHYLKLAQLMHRIYPAENGYTVEVDGPFSLFTRTQKYGVNMSRFLPGLLLSSKWHMEAFVNTPKGERTFVLDQDCGLQSYYQKADLFDSAVEEVFFEQFEKRKTEWQIEREMDVLDLKDTVLIPDFRFTHPRGKQVHLEIIGFWTPEYLSKKVEKLRRADRKDLIVVVNKNLNCANEKFSGPVLYYNTRIKTDKVLKILDGFLESSTF
jgi:predicted nuclease of restriction endonuclease-like RecB superfamily